MILYKWALVLGTIFFQTLIAMSATAQPQDWPSSLVSCAPYESYMWSRKYTVVIENLSEKKGGAEYHTRDSTQKVCDAVQSAAKNADLSTTRLTNDKVLIHGNVLSINGTGGRINSILVPAVCTTFKELGFNSVPDQILEDLSPAAVAKGFNLNWMNQHNEVVLNIHRSRIGSNVHFFLSLNNHCVFSSQMLSIERFRWKINQLKSRKNPGW